MGLAQEAVEIAWLSGASGAGRRAETMAAGEGEKQGRWLR